MTSCKVNFKVISRLPSKTAISTIYVAQILALYILSSYGCWHILISQCVLQKMTSCPSLVMFCPTFDVVHPRRDCKGKKGDTLSIGKKRFEKLHSSGYGSLWVWVYVGVGVVLCGDIFNCFAFPRFCGKNGPDRLPIKGKSAAVVFKSDKKGNGGGADCTIACSDFSPTGQIHCKWYCIAAKQSGSCGQNMGFVVYLSFAEKHWLKNFSESF